MKEDTSVKQVSRIEYTGPYQIQTTSIISKSFSIQVNNDYFKPTNMIPIKINNLDVNTQIPVEG